MRYDEVELTELDRNKLGKHVPGIIDAQEQLLHKRPVTRRKGCSERERMQRSRGELQRFTLGGTALVVWVRKYSSE